MPTTLNWQGWQVCYGVMNSVVGKAHRREHCAKTCRPFLQIYPAGFFLSYWPASSCSPQVQSAHVHMRWRGRERCCRFPGALQSRPDPSRAWQ